MMDNKGRNNGSGESVAFERMARMPFRDRKPLAQILSPEEWVRRYEAEWARLQRTGDDQRPTGTCGLYAARSEQQADRQDREWMVEALGKARAEANVNALVADNARLLDVCQRRGFLGNCVEPMEALDNGRQVTDGDPIDWLEEHYRQCAFADRVRRENELYFYHVVFLAVQARRAENRLRPVRPNTLVTPPRSIPAYNVH